jgi:uncharacterized protein (TIGR02246 family)
MKSRSTFFFIILLTVTSLAAAQSSDVISIKTELNKWMKAYNQKDIENSIAVFSDDYVGYYAGHPDQSRKSMRDQNEEVFKNKYLKATLSMEAVEIETSGDLAYISIKQKWSFKPSISSNPQVALEKGILIMKKQSDGRWKITRSSTFPVSSLK